MEENKEAKGEKKLSKKERKKLKKKQKREEQKKQMEEKQKALAEQKGINESDICANDKEDLKKYIFSIPKPTKESYKKVVDEKAEDLLKLALSDEGWEPISAGQDKGIKAFKKYKEGSPIVYIKSIAPDGTLNFHIINFYLIQKKSEMLRKQSHGMGL